MNNHSPNYGRFTCTGIESPVEALKEKIGWFKLLFSSMVAGIIWLLTRLTDDNSSSFGRVMNFLGLDIDPELAIFAALATLLIGISFTIAIIHENIGKLGDRGLLISGRAQSCFGLFLLVTFTLLIVFDMDRALLRHFGRNALSPGDIPLLASIFIALYIAVVIIFLVPYRRLPGLAKKAYRFFMQVRMRALLSFWNVGRWLRWRPGEKRSGGSGTRRKVIRVDALQWRRIEEVARSRGVAPGKCLVDLAIESLPEVPG